MILIADHAQSDVTGGLDLAGLLGAEWRVLQPNDERPEAAELAVRPDRPRRRRLRARRTGAAAARPRRRPLAPARREEADVVAWLAGPDGEPLERNGVGTPELDGAEAVIEAAAAVRRRRAAGELRFRPGSGDEDLRGGSWDLDGDRSVLGLDRADGHITSDTPPRPLARLWAALTASHAGDVLVSLAPGYETVDWGGMTHVGGGSHGALRPRTRWSRCSPSGSSRAPPSREQWQIADVGRSRPRALRRRRAILAGECTAETAAASRPPSGAWAAAAHGALRRRHPPGHPRAGELGRALQVRRRRRLGLRRQPRRLRRRSSRASASTTSPAAIGAFCVAVTNNFLWNRHWTFDAAGGHAGEQAWRFLTVSVLGLGINLAALSLLVDVAGLPELPGQALAVAIVMPVELPRQQAVDVQSKLITPVTSSSTSVTPAESSSEPQQPSPLEKKTNMATLLPTPEAR